MACGTGYGAALMADHAQQVVGMDIDVDTIKQAQTSYANRANLSFSVGDVFSNNLASDRFDAVVSFETLEHVSEHHELLAEFKRILKQSGVLIISTPDKDHYSAQGHHNHHHVKELTATEFKKLIKQHFKHVCFFGQKLHMASRIEAQTAASHGEQQPLYLEQGKEFQPQLQQQNPMYLIAVATDAVESISELRLGNSNLTDWHEQWFKHQLQQIQRLLAADQRIPELEQQLAQQQALVSHLKARLGL